MIRKKIIIKELQKKLKLKSYKESEIIINAINEIYEEGLKKEGSIKIANLGIIQIGIKKEREIKVPGLDKKIKIPKRKGLFFKANKTFEKNINSQG